jgi:uncharacterized protein YraI
LKGVFMLKNRLVIMRDFIIKHSKVAFPVAIVAAVAATVTVALNVGAGDKRIEELGMEPISASSEITMEDAQQDVPMTVNTDAAITELLTGFYNAWADGDSEKLLSLCDEIEDSNLFSYEEYSKYIESYNVLEIYTKPGPEENSTLAYVYFTTRFIDHDYDVPGYQAFYICTREDGSLYIKRGENTDEVNEYITLLTTQDDVVEFNNRITAEYNNLLMDNPEILSYMNELVEQVKIEVGERLGQLNASGSDTAADTETNTETDENQDNAQEAVSTDVQTAEEQPVEETKYVTATTTVNVRSSDSEKADKLGKVSSGTKLQLVEEKVNGWSEVIFEGKNGFIKTEYLQAVESASTVETIGTVTATTNINVRAAASETADRLGVLSGGDSADLVSTENGWCKIKYNGQIGYVKADYVQ